MPKEADPRVTPSLLRWRILALAVGTFNVTYFGIFSSDKVISYVAWPFAVLFTVLALINLVALVRSSRSS